ncbi:MAG: MarR family transcriptional regulator [Desulfuromonadaceae bacterium]|nr:MarR family transcriptional regulator [Desulfuromonadaceae bacterium]MDD2855403.1 MarR family transcriptional regulator [Desulfuromonadaceae bacterium]
MPTKRSNAAIMDETANNLRRLFRVVNKQSRSEATKTGLTEPQLWALKSLADDTSDSVTVSRLAEQMCLNSSTVVRILDVLEEKMLVKRIRSGHDRRAVYVTITNKGSLILEQSPKVAQNVLLKGLEMLSENKLHSMASGISQLIAILESDAFQNPDLSEHKL